MGVKLLITKSTEDKLYHHYLQEFESLDGALLEIMDDELCPEHPTYIIEFTNHKDYDVTELVYYTGTSSQIYGKAGRL